VRKGGCDEQPYATATIIVDAVLTCALALGSLLSILSASWGTLRLPGCLRLVSRTHHRAVAAASRKPPSDCSGKDPRKTHATPGSERLSLGVKDGTRLRCATGLSFPQTETRVAAAATWEVRLTCSARLYVAIDVRRVCGITVKKLVRNVTANHLINEHQCSLQAFLVFLPREFLPSVQKEYYSNIGVVT